MEEEHALELERLERGGKAWPELDLPVLKRRLRVFLAVSLILSVVVVGVVIWAVTFEQTAIDTITRVTRDVFVPVGTPAP